MIFSNNPKYFFKSSPLSYTSAYSLVSRYKIKSSLLYQLIIGIVTSLLVYIQFTIFWFLMQYKFAENLNNSINSHSTKIKRQNFLKETLNMINFNKVSN